MTSPKTPKSNRLAALQKFRDDFGANVRVMIRHELGLDMDTVALGSVVTSRLRELFDAQPSKERAKDFEKAGLSAEEAAAEAPYSGSPLFPEVPHPAALVPSLQTPRLRRKTADTSKPFTELGGRFVSHRLRIKTAREALCKAASGRADVEPAPDDMHALLGGVLNTTEKEAMAKQIPQGNIEHAWAKLGETLAASLLELWSRKRGFPAGVVATCLRECGWVSLTIVKADLGLDIPPSPWELSEDIELRSVSFNQPVDTGRTGFRTLDREVFQGTLEANSTPTNLPIGKIVQKLMETHTNLDTCLFGCLHGCIHE